MKHIVTVVALSVCACVSTQVMEMGESRAQSFRPAETGTIHIHTLPAHGTVRIRNLEPGFYQGIPVTPGKYHVEVRAEGYERKEAWICVAPGERKQTIVRLEQSVDQ